MNHRMRSLLICVFSGAMLGASFSWFAGDNNDDG